jgi:hypothetical protein
MNRLLGIVLFLFAVTLQTGCATSKATATVDPTLNWSAIKTVHVTKTEGDDNDLDKMIAEKLITRGFAVTRDPQPSTGVDARVTYKDRWMWDITMYMLELTVVLRDPKTDFPLATGNSLHTSLVRKKPAEMVDEVMENILKGRK